jgi:hypothetical protein
MLSVNEFMSDSNTMEIAMEHRRAVRYQLSAPVIFKSVDAQIKEPGAGFVQDISTEGVFVSCPRPLSVGNSIELEILLPPFGADGAKLVVSYIGLVVWADEGGFAVAAKPSLNRYILGGRRIPVEES